MSRLTSPSPQRRDAPDLTSRAYWNGTIKMSLSKLFILRVLNDRPLHGYDIARVVAEATAGCCSPSEGTVYPVLRDFEDGGYVTHEAVAVGGRVRKVYALTDKGRAALAVAVEAWMDITHAIIAADRVLSRPAADTGRCCE